MLVVWLGNFDGAGNPALVGIDAAAPLWLRIADALPWVNNQIEPSRLPPSSLIKVDICSASGDLPNVWCPKLEAGWFIPGKSPIRVSTLHRPVWINKKTGAASCTQNSVDARQEIFEFWPSDLATLFRQAGLPRRQPPSAIDCSKQLAIVSSDAPVITSPFTGLLYTVRQSRRDESLALSATTAADAKLIYWFINNGFAGRSKAGSALAWRPDHAGEYQITATDDLGRSSSRKVAVELLP